MVEQISQVSGAERVRRIDRWTLGAAVLAALVLLPIVAILWIALWPEDNIWPHLISTTLPRYLSNTVMLMLAVGGGSAVIGTLGAWVITMYQFPGRRVLEWALLLPLAVPGYLGAYALVDFLEYAGPLQTALREIFGWANASDYYFPHIRSMGGAMFVLTASLYPYVYLLARAGFREQSGAVYEVARALGAGPSRRFFRVGVPLARPAVAAGTAIVMMETVNDFGTVDYFGVQTLTTGIFTVWLEAGNAGGAAQIATVILSMILLLVVIEKVSRKGRQVHRTARHDRPITRIELTGASRWIVPSLASLPPLLGFAMPVTVLGHHALTKPDRWIDGDLAEALWNTVLVGGTAALVTVTAALFLVYGVRLSGRMTPKRLLPVTTIGYAAPGAVLGIGILLPLATFDNALADTILAITGFDPGLILTGGVAALVYAYSVRFFAIAQGAADAAMDRISPSLSMAARALGQTAGGTLRRVYVPMIRGSIATALLLVFVDCVKELPATLLLRPFNFDTLATRAYEQASLEKIADAAPSGLLVILVSLSAVVFLARSMIRAR